MTWKPLPYKSIRELASTSLDLMLRGLERPNPATGFVWRGEPEVYERGILSRVDREDLLPGKTPDERLGRECEWYNQWWYEMLPLLLTRDRLQPCFGSIPNLDWLNFAAHHGCKTRLVDWSQSPWVALYFACSQSRNKPGRVWCFDADALARVIGPRWDEWGVPPHPNNKSERDIATAAFSPGAKRWIAAQFNLRPPIRMASQQGLFTIASLLDEAHDKLLDDLVPNESKFVITIQSSDKGSILGFLKSMGIHHESLQYPMLDQVAAKTTPDWT